MSAATHDSTNWREETTMRKLRSMSHGLKRAVLLASLAGGVLLGAAVSPAPWNPLFVAADAQAASSPAKYIVMAWNDLGMHCYNRDFQDLAVLPPYNTLWAQVLKVGDPPQLVTSGVTVSYSIDDNT